MASGSGKDHIEEPAAKRHCSTHAQLDHGQSSAAASASADAPIAGASVVGAYDSPRTPSPAPPVVHLPEGQPADEGRSTEGSGPADAAAVDRKGKKVVEDSSPDSGSSSESREEEMQRALAMSMEWEDPMEAEEDKILGTQGRQHTGISDFPTLVQPQRIPLIGAMEHYSPILSPTMGHEVVASHLRILCTQYSEFRPVLGDGECFYRSFIFSYLEQVLDRKDINAESRLLASVVIVARQLESLRFVERNIECVQWSSEFCRSCSAFHKLIEKVVGWKGRLVSVPSTNSYCERKLLKFFSSHNTSDDIFVFLRLVAAIWMCSHREDYEPLLTELGEGYSLELWCSKRLLPCGFYADHVPMRALAAALGVPLRVENLIDGPPHDIYTADGVPLVTLLFSHEHYDIIYPCPSFDQISSEQAAQEGK